jgi:hypothetical protein
MHPPKRGGSSDKHRRVNAQAHSQRDPRAEPEENHDAEKVGPRRRKTSRSMKAVTIAGVGLVKQAVPVAPAPPDDFDLLADALPPPGEPTHGGARDQAPIAAAPMVVLGPGDHEPPPSALAHAISSAPGRPASFAPVNAPVPAPPIHAMHPSIDPAELQQIKDALAASRRMEQELWAALAKEREAWTHAVGRLQAEHDTAIQALRGELAIALASRGGAPPAPAPSPEPGASASAAARAADAAAEAAVDWGAVIAVFDPRAARSGT